MNKVFYHGAAVLEYTPDGGPWIVREAFQVDWYRDDGIQLPLITVPAGFVTDLASIPRILHPILPVIGRHIQPAITHDYCYSDKGCHLKRSEADRLFLDGMKVTGVRLTRRWVMYLAVRCCGWVPWWHHRRQDRSGK